MKDTLTYVFQETTCLFCYTKFCSISHHYKLLLFSMAEASASITKQTRGLTPALILHCTGYSLFQWERYSTNPDEYWWLLRWDRNTESRRWH